MKKKKKLGGPMLLNSTTYYKFTLINPVWYWLKYRHIDQWNRTEIVEINSYIYGQVIFNNGAKKQSIV